MTSMNENIGLYKQSASYNEKTYPYLSLTQPWWVQVKHPTYPPQYGCKIEPLICGELVFRQIAKDLNAAKDSVDIITWGFDPGMVLERGTTAHDGLCYGELLRKIATRRDNPVKVRLLVWHDSVLTEWLMKNIPGYYGKRFPAIGCGESGYYSEAHQSYNAYWFDQVNAGKIMNISFHVRSIPPFIYFSALKDEVLPSSFKAKRTAEYCTHHQKMLLIDYECPQSSIGYVMGHNSITDFWDTEEHFFRNPRREWIYTVDPAKEMNRAYKEGPQIFPVAPGYSPSEYEIKEKERAVQAWLEKNRHVSKPYQDVSIRLQGPVLHELNNNFCEAWKESERPGAPIFEQYAWRSQFLTKRLDAINREMDPDFIERRAKISSSDFMVADGEHCVQLMRTQPMHYEKTIKECYANLTRQMNHYIFIQNQYVQYGPWAEHLKKCVQRLRTAGYVEKIYVFILTSTPEKDGMDLPTYDVASKIGKSESMVQEHAEALKKWSIGKGEIPILPGEMAKQGIKVVMGSMWTCAIKAADEKLRADDYEEIYIHAKVAIVDDVAFTLGSANLNLRSMALDSELNVLSQAHDVAYKLRANLFQQCSGDPGPAQFKDMAKTFSRWEEVMADNTENRVIFSPLKSQLLLFHVDRKPGSPLI